VDHLAARLQITLAPSLTVAERTQHVASSDGPVVSVGVADERAPAMEAEALDVYSIHAAGSEGGASRSRRANVLLTGAEATRDAVMTAMSGARLTHLACHGLFRATNPSFSGLHLADGWLRAMDLAVLDLRGSTVVLGACESGRMEHQGGDETVGLAASLIIAGARYVVVSSWMADDEVTRQLMNLFHLNLVNGHRPGEALRLAQVAIRRKHPHPFHWAPFVVVGAPDSSEEQHADTR
jgi:CHAT domain-containing protein